MSTNAYEPPQTDEAEELYPYRAVSKAAVFSISLALLSLGAFMFEGLLMLPMLGLLFGILGIRNIARYPNELSGRPAAILGTVISVICLIGAGAYHATIYATEVPEGYERISFYELQPDLINHPELPVPPNALELNGKQVFVKGYIHPAISGHGPVQQFVLVPDMGTCCFGGQPKLTDMIEVTLKDGLSAVYSTRKQRLAGKLKVDARLKPVTGLKGVYYQLDAEHLN